MEVLFLIALLCRPSGDDGPSPCDAPSVKHGRPNIVGNLDKAIIRRFLKRFDKDIVACAAKHARADHTERRVEVTLAFDLVPAGAVRAVRVTGPRRTARCVRSVVEKLELRSGPGMTQVRSYPLTIDRGADAASPARKGI